MPSDPVELTKQIKAASDIVAVVGSYLAVKPAGAVFKALCPFHQDSRPSLDVDPKRQRYRCWACGQHGDAFAFVQHMEKVGFAEARLILARRAGINLDDRPSPHDLRRTRLLDVMRWAQEKYRHALLDDPAGEAARKYLGGRKLAGKTVRDFGLGFAPLAGDWLVRLAAADRVPSDVLVEVGLTAPRQENQGYYDRFRDRVMFPIRDVRGQTIAFGGRILPESPYAARAPKYYNSAETPLFSKSDVLYGLDLARHAGAACGYLAVVEGYTDVMMAHQCGVPQVVATMGTALNARHVAQLRRYAPKVVLVYDADAGGLTGVDRALDTFVSQDVELAVATLPDGLDPCDLLVRPDGVETFRQLLSSAADALDFALDRLLEREANPSVETTRAILDRVLRVMAAAGSWRDPRAYNTSTRVKQELIVTRLAHRLSLRLETVWARFGELKREEERKAPPAGPKAAAPQAVPAAPARRAGEGGAAKPDPHYFLAATLIRLLGAEPALVPAAAAGVRPEDVGHTGIRRILTEMYAAWAAGQVPDTEALRERLADRPDLFDSLVAQAEVGRQIEDRPKKLQGVIADFRRLQAEAEQKAITARLSTATDEERVELLRRKLQAGVRKNAG